VNLAGVWWAAGSGEAVHATVHAALAVLFGLGGQRLALRKRPAGDGEAVGGMQELATPSADVGQLKDVEGRLAELEERLDFTERVLGDVRARAQQPPEKK
jgi:hypothetical protein